MVGLTTRERYCCVTAESSFIEKIQGSSKIGHPGYIALYGIEFPGHGLIGHWRLVAKLALGY